ncbi:MAG: hypothetical protein JWM74_5569 [Myxococcaceae bacterium]|nr:hypothetical protein [Myxococcaceae bacterium]
MTASWRRYAEARGFDYAPQQAIGSGGRRRPVLVVSGPVMRGAVQGIELHVRTLQLGKKTCSRVQGRAVAPLPLGVIARSTTNLPGEPHVFPAEMRLADLATTDDLFDRAFTTKVTEPGAVRTILGERVRTALVDLVSRRSAAAFFYDRGLSGVVWDGIEADDAVVDLAVEIVILACTWRGGVSEYR